VARQGYQNYLWFLRTFVERGGKLTLGSNAANARRVASIPGPSLFREIEQLVTNGGLSPMKAIQAATVWPATLSGRTPDLGTLENGKLADLILVSRNPLDDITALKNIDMVMQGGRFQRTGYHYSYANPIPLPDTQPVTEGIPARIASISPEVVVEAGGDVRLTVKGREFLSSSIIKIGDRLLDTTVVNPTQLEATVPASLVQSVGTHRIRVVHRFPGWGETNSVNLVVKFR
jgi:adenine deaminase